MWWAVAWLGLTAPTAAGASGVTRPPANGTFEYQIGGAFPPAAGTRIVVRDRGDPPAAGLYNVCYVNAFQTQPEQAAWWKANHRRLLLRRRNTYVVDSAWNEMLLDTSTATKRAELATIVGGWFDSCRRAGYEAVEPDNLDSWTRSRGRLRAAQNFAMARLLIARAHAHGLAIAQKNTAELGRAGRTMGFDFAIAEECAANHECGAYTRAFGDQVYEVEYTDNGARRGFRAACAARGASISITYRDRQVKPRGAPGSVSEFC